MLDFPNSPSVGATFTSGGATWTWDGTKWTMTATGGGGAGGASITVSDTPPSSPTVGALWFDSVGAQLYAWYNDGTSSQWVIANNQSIGGTALAGLRNRLINGNFAVNQRGQVSGTALVAAAYGHDRWKAGASGCTYTFTAGVPDTLITITAGTLTQVIENVNIEGGSYRLSWSGTAQARVYQGSPSGAYAASPVSVSGITAGTNTIIEFNTGTLGLVQLEPGLTVTPFERRPIGNELALCQRYYQRYTGTAAALQLNGYNSAASNVTNTFLFPAMRVAPTAAFIGTWTVTNCGAPSLIAAGANSMLLYAVATATGVVNAASPANGGFDLSAEL